MFRLIVSALIGYLLGCVATGVLISKHMGIDIRTVGSKSSGATNMTRVLGIGPGLWTFLGDIAKATLAYWLGYFIAGRDGALLAGLFSVIGHNWPVFLRFKGGKGVACSCAVIFWASPLIALAFFVVAIAIIWLTRYVSVGSMAILVGFALASLILRPFWPDAVWAVILAVMSVYQHRTNIDRLIKGTENRFEPKAKK